MSNEVHLLLLDLEDHRSYVRDAEEDLLFAVKNGGDVEHYTSCLATAKQQVEDIRAEIRKHSCNT